MARSRRADADRTTAWAALWPSYAVPAVAYLLLPREYAHELDRAEDTARRGVAADLHDGIGQILAGQAMLLGALRPLEPGDQAHGFLNDSLIASQEAQIAIGSTIQDLSLPELEETSVGVVLHGIARLFESRYRFRVGIKVSGGGPISDERLRVIYRVVRELLFNPYNHSRADRAEVIVDQFTERANVRFSLSQVQPARPRRIRENLRNGMARRGGALGWLAFRPQLAQTKRIVKQIRFNGRA